MRLNKKNLADVPSDIKPITKMATNILAPLSVLVLAVLLGQKSYYMLHSVKGIDGFGFNTTLASGVPIPTGYVAIHSQNRLSRMDPIIFGVEGIKKLLQNLLWKKANGPDNIPTRLIKDTAPEITEVVYFLLNQAYSLSQFPADWCKANVEAIFKKAAKQDSNNYRPVSLTVVLCKLIEHVIYRSIMQHLEYNNILCSKQHDFRKNHSCETQLLLTIEELAKNLDEGIEVDL